MDILKMAPRDGLLGAARLALRVALRAIAAAARRRRTVLLSVGGSNLRPNGNGASIGARFEFF
jgi:hypothetical protein